MIEAADFIVELTAIFRQELDENYLSISMTTVQSDLDSWDSLAHVRIVMALERAYGIQFDVTEIETINSVRGFYDAVNRQLG